MAEVEHVEYTSYLKDSIIEKSNEICQSKFKNAGDNSTSAAAFINELSAVHDKCLEEFRKRWIGQRFVVQKKILDGEFSTWMNGPCVNPHCCSTELIPAIHWLDNCTDFFKRISHDLTTPGTVDSNLEIWKSFLDAVLKRMDHSSALYLAGHLRRTRKVARDRMRSQELDNQLLEKISSWRPSADKTCDENSASSYEATLHDPEVDRERALLEHEEDPHFDGLKKLVLELFRESNVPNDYREFVLTSIASNNWAQPMPWRSSMRFSVTNVYKVRSDDPYAGYHWEHVPTYRYQSVEAPFYRWYYCSITALDTNGFRMNFNGWVENVLLKRSGANTEKAFEMTMQVHKNKFLRHMDVLPTRIFYGLTVRPELLKEPEFNPFKQKIIQNIVYTPSLLPLPKTCPVGPMSVEIVKRMLLTFVVSFSEHTEEEQNILLTYCDEPEPDHSGWEQYVKHAYDM